jgi:lipopolysaccharide biosynthesis protein
MLFTPATPKAHLHPMLLNKYFLQAELAAAFSPSNVAKMKELYQIIFATPMVAKFNDLYCIAGTMFWARYEALEAKKITVALPQFSSRWAKAYVNDNGIEHALERLIPTWIIARGGQIAEIYPAPKVAAMYLPQYHRIPENDNFFGDGFTEWSILQAAKDYLTAKPLPTAQGGLGYYDLTQVNIRQRQAGLARVAGVHSFVFYHYWFSGPTAPKDHLVMHKIPELRLLDGQPDVHFMFSWKNEPWVRPPVRNEPKPETLLDQDYGDREDWIAHFNYLLQVLGYHLYTIHSHLYVQNTLLLLTLLTTTTYTPIHY